MELLQIKEGLYIPKDFATTHKYFADPDGKKPYTGVTSVIGVLAKPNLIPWAAKEACKRLGWLDPKYASEEARMASAQERLGEIMMASPVGFLEMLDEAVVAHARKKDTAAEHGTDAHAEVEAYIKMCLDTNQGYPINDGGYPTVDKFVTWAVENVDHFLFSERRMADPELFVAGTADFAAVMIDGRKKLMGDYKTSSGIYGIDYFLQCAAYRHLAEKEGDAPYDGCVIVRQGKEDPEDFEVQYRFDYQTDWNAFVACLTIYRANATWKRPSYKKYANRKTNSK